MFNGPEFSFLGAYLAISNDVSQVSAARHPELALLWLDREPRLPEFLQHSAEVTDVILPAGAKYNYIIQVGCCIVRAGPSSAGMSLVHPAAQMALRGTGRDRMG